MTLREQGTGDHDWLWEWALYREDGIRFSSLCSVAFYEMNIFRCYNRRNR